MPYTKTPASGITNIGISVSGKHFVQVRGEYLGTFSSLEKAIEVRDKDRAKKGMPAI